MSLDKSSIIEMIMGPRVFSFAIRVVLGPCEMDSSFLSSLLSAIGYPDKWFSWLMLLGTLLNGSAG